MRRPRLRSLPRPGFSLRAISLTLFVCAAAAQAQPSKDEAFLEDLSRRTFLYFWEQTDSQTGLVLDRARTTGERHDSSHHSHNIASSGATGFGLTALAIAAERGWIKDSEARERVRATLNFFARRAEHKNGWFYHWMDLKTGERRWTSEISSIDTALLLAGVLTASGSGFAPTERS